jgi:hypothetical protein
VCALWATAYRLGRTWGSTDKERARELPGDELVASYMMGGNHAITINAAPSDVWPWVVQMGWQRGGWYTYRWVDQLLFPQNAASADRVLPEFQSLRVGDRIPDGPPELGCFFTVEEIETNHHLVLRSNTHLPPQLLGKDWAEMNWTWVFVVEPTETGTRFQFRWRAELRPLWLRLIYQALVPPADLVMGRSMCKGIKSRVESLSARSLAFQGGTRS